MKENFDVFFDKDNIGSRWMNYKKDLDNLYSATIPGVFFRSRSEICVFDKVEEGFEWFSFVKLDDYGRLIAILHNVNPNGSLSEDFEGFYVKCQLCVDRDKDEDEDEDILSPYVECHKIS